MGRRFSMEKINLPKIAHDHLPWNVLQKRWFLFQPGRQSLYNNGLENGKQKISSLDVNKTLFDDVLVFLSFEGFVVSSMEDLFIFLGTSALEVEIIFQTQISHMPYFFHNYR